jgi:dihydropteroate synthase
LKEFQNNFPNPLLLGASRKSLLKKVIGDETIYGDSAITTRAAALGVNIVRVHDFKEMRDVIKVCEKLYY